MAVALLARRPDALNDLATSLRKQTSGGVFETFPTDTAPENLHKVFQDIRAHQSFQGLKLKLSIFSIKNSAKKPFMSETFADFMDPLSTYVGGAMCFAQESLKLLFEHHGEASLADGAGKKGTIIFTGTLGALRCNAEFASYGASRASVRQLAQALAREMSARGVQVVHAVANGRIVDAVEEGDVGQGKSMSGEAVGRTYLYVFSVLLCCVGLVWA